MTREPALNGAPAKFVTGSLARHVTVMALSGTAGLTFTFLVDFLALWWIGRLGQEQMIAAVGIAGTIQFAVMSVAIGMMIGAVALVSRTLGRGEREKARHIAGTALALSVAVQTGLAAAVWTFRVPILTASGAEGAVLDLADRFLTVSLPSLPLIALGITSSGLLRAAGDAWRSMTVTMAGGAVAIVLDPLLIVWAGWNVTGAALSIVIARAAMAGAGVWFLIAHHRMLRLPSRADFGHYVRPYAAIVLPAIATQLSTPFGNWIVTREMAAQGDSAVAGWGVVMRLTILAFGGIFALSGAIGGIIGQNYGAGRPDRVAGAFVAALRFCAAYTLTTWAVMALLGGTVAASFGLSADGLAVVRAFTHVSAGAFIFTGALFVANAAFNNLGRPLRSTAANWTRDGLLMAPLAWAGATLAGGPGIVWGQGVANVLAGTAAALLAWRHIARLRRDHAAAGPV